MATVSGAVLVVEDDERSRRLLCDVLEAAGHTVVAATNGAEAIALATASPPALVLLDVQLPDVDGVEVVGRLRRERTTAAVPIVAVTAFAMKGDRERLLAAGFDEHVAKPVDVRALPAFVERILDPGAARVAER